MCDKCVFLFIFHLYIHKFSYFSVVSAHLAKYNINVVCRSFFLIVSRVSTAQQQSTSHPAHTHNSPQTTSSTSQQPHLHTNTLYDSTDGDRQSSVKRTGAICKTTGIFLYDICRGETFVALASDRDNSMRNEPFHQNDSPSFSRQPNEIGLTLPVTQTSDTYRPITTTLTTTTSKQQQCAPLGTRSTTHHDFSQRNIQTTPGRDHNSYYAQSCDGMHVHRIACGFYVFQNVCYLFTV